MKKSFSSVLVIAIVLAAFGGASANSILQKIFPAIAGGAAVMAVAKPLNDLINSVLAANGVANRDHTKVVPILTIGANQYIGAAQVSGPSYAVDRVLAVVELKGQTHNGVWNVDGLIPIDSINPLRGIRRVYGTGVDAVINAQF